MKTCETCKCNNKCSFKYEIQKEFSDWIHTCTGWKRTKSIKKEFIEFLEEYGWDDKFYHNWTTNPLISPLTDPIGYISSAFEWKYTPEKSGFWSWINILWQRRLREIT